MIDDAHLIEHLLHHAILSQSQIDHARTLQRPNEPLYDTLLEQGVGSVHADTRSLRHFGGGRCFKSIGRHSK